MRKSNLPPVYPELAASIARSAYSHTDFAIEVGIHPTTLSRVIHGYMRPTEALRQRMADVLEIEDVDWLFQFAPEIERLIQMAVDQGLGRSVKDMDTLRRIAVLTQPHSTTQTKRTA